MNPTRCFRSFAVPAPVAAIAAIAAMLFGCAGPGYSPPPERRGQDRCPTGEVWICEDRYPSRLESEREPEPFCRCGNPARLP